MWELKKKKTESLLIACVCAPCFACRPTNNTGGDGQEKQIDKLFGSLFWPFHNWPATAHNNNHPQRDNGLVKKGDFSFLHREKKKKNLDPKMDDGVR